MTQSNLSKHIKQLENELGFSVVTKRGTKFEMTYEGERFLNACNSIFDLYTKTVDECRKSQMERRGGLLVQEPSYMDSTGEHYYMLIEEMRASVPDLPIKFFRPYRKNLKEELLNGEMDVAIFYRSERESDCLKMFSDSGLGAAALAEDSLVLWCSKEHPFASRTSVSLTELEGIPIVAPNDTYAPITQLLSYYGRERNVQIKFAIVESDRAANYLSRRMPDCAFVLPSSIRNDLRVKVRKDMELVPIDEGSLTFTSYAAMKLERLALFPEFASCFSTAE